MTNQEKERVAQAVEGYLSNFPSSPPAPGISLTADTEGNAALVWVAVAIYRWLQSWKGKQHVRITSVTTWWEKDKREGKFRIRVLHATKEHHYVVQVFPYSHRYLGVRIFKRADESKPNDGTKTVWTETAVSYSDPYEGWKIEPMPKDSRARGVQGF